MSCFQNLTHRALIAGAAALTLGLTFAAPSSAGPNLTCEEQGYATFHFASGWLDPQGPAIHEICRQEWDDWAHQLQGTGFYTHFETTTWLPSGQVIRRYTCVTCTGSATAILADPGLSVDMSGAGDIAGSMTQGTIVKMERHDRFQGTDRSMYSVDVMTDRGKVQVLVDGRTGEAKVLDGSQESAEH